MSKKKKIAILLSLLLTLLIPITVFAVISAQMADVTKGGFSQNTVDRLNINIDATEFTFKKSDSGTYMVEFTLTAEKTEGEFYGVLNSVEFSGLDFDYMLLTGDNGENTAIDDTVLPSVNGTPQTLSWKVQIPCKITATGEYTAEFSVSYTSGLTKDSADSRVLTVPITVTVK